MNNYYKFNTEVKYFKNEEAENWCHNWPFFDTWEQILAIDVKLNNS